MTVMFSENSDTAPNYSSGRERQKRKKRRERRNANKTPRIHGSYQALAGPHPGYSGGKLSASFPSCRQMLRPPREHFLLLLQTLSSLCPQGPPWQATEALQGQGAFPPRRRFNLSLGKVVVGARPRCIFKHCPFLEIRVPQNNGPLHPQARCCLLGNGARTTVPETIG